MDLITSIFRKEPADRLTATEVLEHPFFRQADVTGDRQQFVGETERSHTQSIEEKDCHSLASEEEGPVKSDKLNSRE